LPFTVVISSLSYSLIKGPRQDFPNSPTRPGSLPAKHNS
jgi:hypothetical protein